MSWIINDCMPFRIISNVVFLFIDAPTFPSPANFLCFLSQLISGTDCKFAHKGGSMILISCSLVLFNQITLHSLNSPKPLWDICSRLCVCMFLSAGIHACSHQLIMGTCAAWCVYVGIWAWCIKLEEKVTWDEKVDIFQAGGWEVIL